MWLPEVSHVPCGIMGAAEGPMQPAPKELSSLWKEPELRCCCLVCHVAAFRGPPPSV